MVYVVMFRDELGEEQRAFGSPNLEREWKYASVDWDNEIEVQAFYAWKDSIEDMLQTEWEGLYGEESTVFLERKYSDMSMSDWARLGYYTGGI